MKDRTTGQFSHVYMNEQIEDMRKSYRNKTVDMTPSFGAAGSSSESARFQPDYSMTVLYDN